jgi:hypothetical protein
MKCFTLIRVQFEEIMLVLFTMWKLVSVRLYHPEFSAMNLDGIYFRLMFRLLKHPATCVTPIGFMVWHVEVILKLL